METVLIVALCVMYVWAAATTYFDHKVNGHGGYSYKWWEDLYISLLWPLGLPIMLLWIVRNKR